MTAPVLLIGFNRPDKLKLSLEAISKTSVTRILVVLDGPRAEKDDEQKIDMCKNLANSFSSSFESFELIVREKNLGCRHGVQDALKLFFSEYDSGIVVEDDILISQEFVDFATWSLGEYQDDREIWVINGWSPFERGEIEMLPWLGRIPTVWGWATWSDRWESYDPNIASSLGCVPSELISNLSLPASIEFNKFWDSCFKKIRQGWDTWDYQLVYSMWKNGGLALNPPVRLTQNIGFDESATHTFKPHGRSARLLDLKGLDKSTYPFKKLDNEIIMRAEELQFGYRLKNIHKIKLLRQKDRLTVTALFLAAQLDISEFSTGINQPSRTKWIFFWFRILSCLSKTSKRLICTLRRIGRVVTKLQNYLYWGVRSRLTHLFRRLNRVRNYVYWGVRSRLTRIIKKK